MVSQEIVNLNTAIHDRVIELLGGEHRGALLDLGAGDGTLAERLQEEGFDVTAVDAIIDDFRPAGIDVKMANLNEGIPFGESQFQVVVSTEVIEHLENPWLFMRELYRVTEPGGAVIISTPNLYNVYVRAWYALTGRLYNFLDSAYQHIGHITPVYLWNLERMAEDKFDVEVVTVNASPIPKTRFRLPTRSRMFGQCVIVKLRRRPGLAVAAPRAWTHSRIVRLGIEAAMTEPDERHYVDCAVIIVTYNSAHDIVPLLDSLPAAAGGLTLRIIVVDNDSADDTVERVRDHPGVICVDTGANRGYSGGINVGRRQAGPCGALAVLNPDLVLEPGALYEMFSALDDPAVGVVVPMLLDFEGHRDPSLRREPTLASEIGDALFGHHFKRRPGWMSDVVRDDREYGYRHAVDWATGAVMLISAACDRVVGAWDERFFLYMEEVDYAARVRAAGLRVEYVPQARTRHRGAGSGQSTALLALMAVNRVRYFEKDGRPARVLRGVVLLNQFLRMANPSHRAALRAVSRRSAWEPLISELKARSEGTEAVSSPACRPYKVS